MRKKLLLVISRWLVALFNLDLSFFHLKEKVNCGQDQKDNI